MDNMDNMKKKSGSTRLTRALSERMYFIRHMTSTTDDGQQLSCYLVTGQSGNLYTVSLPESASNTLGARCNCVDHAIRKTVCKHLIFVCARVLKARPQLFEREQSGAHSLRALAVAMRPLLPRAAAAAGAPRAPAAVQRALQRAVPTLFAARRPRVARRAVEAGDECGICCEPLLHGGGGGAERLDFCAFGCGRAVHAACFARYRAVTPDVRCVLCRAQWDDGDDGRELLGKRGLLVRGRLVRVGGEQGMEGEGEGEEEADEREHDGTEAALDEEWTPESAARRRKRKRRAAPPSSSGAKRARRADGMRLRSGARLARR